MARWASVLLASVLAAPGLPAQELTDDSFEKLLTYVLPKEGELKWAQIPWRPVFWDGLIEAQNKDMPILLWAMNGHPLACG